jgi:hypothetical protein
VSSLRRLRLQHLSLAGLGVTACLVAAVISPWSIRIPAAHLAEGFGFQTPACWIVVVALAVALVSPDGRTALVALLAGEIVLAAWFGWAAWVVTTPRFVQLGYPFVAFDVLGPGWYAAATGLPVAAVDVVLKMRVWQPQPAADIWFLAALPGFGLARLGKWYRGLVWLALVAICVYMASLQSPDPTTWQDLGPNNVPTPFPNRAPVWFFLALAAGIWAGSVLDTYRQARRQIQPR